MTVQDGVRDFTLSRRLEGFTERTIDKYRRALDLVTRWSDAQGTAAASTLGLLLTRSVLLATHRASVRREPESVAAVGIHAGRS